MARAVVALGVMLVLGCSGSDDSDPSPRDGNPGRRDGGGGGEGGEPSTSGEPDAGPSTTGGDGGGGGAGGGTGGNPATGGTASEPPPPMEVDLPPGCEAPALNQPYEELRCAGLYTDIATKEIAAGVEEFLPAHQLWSDGAEKQRWIYLPPDTQIDSSRPDDWRFPVGTKLFKEFRSGGRRVETRLFWKTRATLWLKAAYQWNAAETEATRFEGGDVDVGGSTYHVPTPTECDQCHKGRIDRALGFELVSLALPGATGMTLARLIADDRLTDPPAETDYAIGDDGTGKAAAALGWLHVNCGVSCHNRSSTAEAYKTDMYLRLPADGIDGRSPAGFDLLTTTVGVASRTPRWLGRQRITPGSPETSLLYELMAMRDPANPKDQMPPIASRVVDDEGVLLVGDWIRAMSAGP